MQSSSTRWLRFGLGHLFVLTLGVAIGFTPFKLWELGAPPEPAIMVHMQIAEVPRDELPGLALDDRALSAGSTSDNTTELPQKLEALCRAKRATLLSRPTIMTLNGQPGSIVVGQEIPIVEPAGEGKAVAISFKEVGLRVDLLPTILRNGRVRLELAPRLSELDPSQAIQVNDQTVPGVRTRSADTTIETDFGSTIVLAGLNDDSPRDRDSEVVIVATVEKAPATTAR